MKLTLLRNLLVFDAAVLLLLGVLLILFPQRIEVAFHFKDLPGGVDYIIGLWGCALATMSIGYLTAASDPIRHVAWVQVGIARGALELVLGLICLLRGTVTFQQAGFGIIIAGLMSAGYIVLYPRKPRLVNAAEGAGPAPGGSGSL
jgi:hypothetical protein